MSTHITTEAQIQEVEAVVEQYLIRKGLLPGVAKSTSPVIEVGQILLGTCKCTEDKKDYFVILPHTRDGDSERKLDIKSLTKDGIGWGDNRNAFPKGVTLEEFNSGETLSHGGTALNLNASFKQYRYEITKLHLDQFKK